MKSFFIPFTLLILIACGKTGDHADHPLEEVEGESPNRALYDQVMDIHDEVMPKMENLYTLKKELQDRIAQSPGMSEDKKKELEQMILTLDSTGRLMMDWMHHFNPLPDSTDQEAAREYLESEMESIKQVRDLTLETLKKAEAIEEKK